MNARGKRRKREQSTHRRMLVAARAAERALAAQATSTLRFKSGAGVDWTFNLDEIKQGADGSCYVEGHVENHPLEMGTLSMSMEELYALTRNLP